MATKTITVDLEAYDILSAQKRRGQSFSQVIKRMGARRTAAGLLAVLPDIARGMSGEALDAMVAEVARRRSHRLRAPRL
ncbi:MAG: hypothetical protein HY722_07780 [Planctomycetes bacterium]|nr:hypothetical protein [Planctomycetota bacterium]